MHNGRSKDEAPVHSFAHPKLIRRGQLRRNLTRQHENVLLRTCRPPSASSRSVSLVYLPLPAEKLMGTCPASLASMWTTLWVEVTAMMPIRCGDQKIQKEHQSVFAFREWQDSAYATTAEVRLTARKLMSFLLDYIHKVQPIPIASEMLQTANVPVTEKERPLLYTVWPRVTRMLLMANCARDIAMS